MDALRGITLVGATVTTGLVAGLLFAFMVSVMPGLARSGDLTFVEGMQRINVAILNGWFALTFGGAPLLLAAAVALHLPAGHRTTLPWLVAALVLYAVVLGITFAVNVPLNDALAAAGDPGAAVDLADARARFEDRWVRANTLRGVAAIAAFGALVLALLRSSATGA